MLLGFALLVGLVWGMMLTPAIVQAQGGPTGAAYRGKRLWTQNCVRCHGEQGKGDGELSSQMPVPIADFANPEFVQTRSPSALFTLIKEGKMETMMPPWGQSLSDAQIWDAVAYVWSLHLSSADMASANQIYSSACASCHGVDGAGGGQQPALSNLIDAKWMDVNEADLVAAIQPPKHEAISGLMAQDVKLAAAASRQFSLGLGINSPKLEGNGEVQVTVSNGTSGKLSPGATVQLLIFDDVDFLTSREAVADAQGVAQFPGIAPDPGLFFQTQTTFNETVFVSEMMQFQPTDTTLPIDLPVYDPGGVVDDVRVSRAHWVVAIESSNGLDMGELYSLMNTGNRVYMGETMVGDGKPAVLEFELPAQAVNIAVEGDAGAEGRFIIEGNKVVDTQPLTPGGRQLLFRYSLPATDGVADLTHPIAYPIDNLNLLVPDVGITVEAPDWVQGQPMGTSGGSYLNFILTNVAQGASPQARISGLETANVAESAAGGGSGQVIDPNATPGLSGQPWAPFAVVGLGVLVLAGGTVFVLRRRRTQPTASPRTRAEARQNVRQDLIQQIADLDDRYGEGELTEADYQSQRRLLKTRLVSLMQSDR